MSALPWVLVALPPACFAYAYLVYPAALWIAARRRRPAPPPADPPAWPSLTIMVPAYNEAARIRDTIESLLAIDYPADRRQILIVSDASTDDTDAIVREYATRGVELLRIPTRGGKTMAENRAGAAIRGAIVVNTDASIRIHPHAVKALVRAFADPTVGVASGRDVSVGDEARERNRGESGYVGYEMWVRDLETRLGSIVGASGCCYAARAAVQRVTLPPDLARDFAAPLLARRAGLRAVSVPEATCVVPRAASLATEFRRKIRTMAQGIETLRYGRELLDPRRHGAFALMLASHKLARWLVYLTLPVAGLGLVWASTESRIALVLLVAAVAALALGVAAVRWPAERRVPAPLALAGFVVMANLAGVLAWVKVLRRERVPIWEPTRRPL